MAFHEEEVLLSFQLPKRIILKRRKDQYLQKPRITIINSVNQVHFIGPNSCSGPCLFDFLPRPSGASNTEDLSAKVMVGVEGLPYLGQSRP